MKKIVFINSVIGNGSTGRICIDLAKQYEKKGYDVKIAYGRGKCDEKHKKYAVKIGNIFDVLWHVLMTRLFDLHGLCSISATKKFIKWLDEYNPTEIWLHNIHGYYLNYKVLFNWIKNHRNIKIKWTLHDSWAYTGHCSQYAYANCYKWEKKCENCQCYYEYPKCVAFGRCKKNYEIKKSLFTNISNLELITPSNWLKNDVRKSFLKKYKISVIYNKIDKKIFKPTKTSIFNNFKLNDKIVLLGLSSMWEETKGLNDIIELYKMLDDRFAFILVGISKAKFHNVISKHSVFKHELKDIKVKGFKEAYISNYVLRNNNSFKKRIIRKNIAIPTGINSLYNSVLKLANLKKYKHNGSNPPVIFLGKTNNPKILAGIYSYADIFINPTYDDTFPTVNLEAKACGTSIITYDVGGCKETLYA